MPGSYIQWIINLLVMLLAFLGGWLLKTVSDGQKSNTQSINDLYRKHLPLKVDKTDFTRFGEILFHKIDSLIDAVSKSNESLNKIDKDLTEKVNSVDRRVAVIESGNHRRKNDPRD